MASGSEGLLTLSIGMRVSPEPGAIELLRRYNTALNYAINKILSLGLRSIGRVHNALYRELREWFGLPSMVPLNAIGMPLQIPMPGGTILGKGGGLGLGSYQCYYIQDRDTGLKKATWRS
ncbi:MAG: hypothetical protein RQ885_15415 [Desulfurococcales archaeon]|jgi:hypothetical protein|nr:hypothetical protein [Desulfurococcales archaeon]